MKHLLTILLTALMGWSPVLAQKKTADKKVHVKVDEEKNGKTVHIDSVFSSKAEADAYLKSQGLDVPPPPPAPPVPPVAGAPRPPAPPTPPGKGKSTKRISISTDGGEGEEKQYTYAYTYNDDSLEEVIEKSMEHAMAFDMPGFERSFHFENGSDGQRSMVIHREEKPDNSYRLEFRMEEPGNAKITVQGKDGKMMYEESLEGVEGNFHRDFDLQKYAGATLQLTVQSGKSKQTRKLVL